MNLDSNAIADVIEQMVKKSTDKIVNRTYKRGVIAAVDGQFVDVYIEGNTVTTKNVICIDSYPPAINDKVLILSIGDTGSNLVVLGSIQNSSGGGGTGINTTPSIALTPFNARPGTGTWDYGFMNGFKEGTVTINNFTGAAIGNYVEFQVYLSAGTYKTRVNFMSGAGEGTVECFIDGVSHYSVDAYTASTSGGSVVSSNVVIASTGIHTWKYLVTGKNASSTGYSFRIFGLYINVQ